MSDNILPTRQPATTPEIGELLGLGKTDESRETVHDSRTKTAPEPGNLPVAEAHSTSPADLNHSGNERSAKELEIEEEKQQSAFLRILKIAGPYIAVFAVGLGLYYFFFSRTNVGDVLSRLKPSAETVQTPKETALEKLINANLPAYEAWVTQYYFDVSDNSVIDPKADNSGNGLSNFHKYLLNLNPREYDTLGLGMADSESLAQGINPLTGGQLTDKQKDIISKYFDMEVIMNRLTLSHRNSSVAGSSTQTQARSASVQASAQTISAGAGVFARGGSSQAVVVNHNNPAGNAVNQNVVIQNSTQQNNILGMSDISTNTPGLLEIPSLNVSAPIVWSSNPKNFDKDLQSGVIHYPGTAMPGQVGTSYISGHSSNVAWAKGNYNRVFSRLGDLANNTSFSITVTLNSGKKVKQHYVVARRAEYKATDQEQFKNAGVPTVALSTCWPVNTTQRRLVVFGELTQVEQ